MSRSSLALAVSVLLVGCVVSFDGYHALDEDGGAGNQAGSSSRGGTTSGGGPTGYGTAGTGSAAHICAMKRTDAGRS